MSKLRLTYFTISLALGLASAKAQDQTLLPPKNILAEYISTGEMNLQWNSDKEILIIASPHQLRTSPNKKAYSYCTKYGSGATLDDGFVVYKGKKNAIIVSGLEMGQYFYFTTYEANAKGVFNIPGPPLTSFVVWSIGTKAEINFKATTVSADQHYIIEKSADGKNWNEIATMNASQELKGVVGYNYVDKGPLNGDYTYRLKQGVGNTYVSSEPISIQSFSFSNVFETWQSETDPNNWFVVSDVTMEINVVNALGEVVKRVSLEEQNNYGYMIDDLPNGIYSINGTNYNGKLNSKITVNR
jgi:hypothetical protein